MTDSSLFETTGLKERLGRLAEFIPIFEADGFRFATMRGGAESTPGIIEMPWCEFSHAADRFVECCYSDGWVLSQFHWPEWIATREAADLRDDADTLARATPERLAMLLTAMIRQDRLVDGLLQEAFNSGLLVAILRRARELGVSMA